MRIRILLCAAIVLCSAGMLEARSDTVTIDVCNDSCEAAQAVPGYQPLVGDLNGDCRVDDADLALLQENWLQDNSLTEDWSLLP